MPEKLKPLEILANPDNTLCTCTESNCEWHGNCKDCVALHRYYDSLPMCLELLKDKKQN